MPASAIQQSLSALLPTHAQRLPAPLTHLSESLLAQSRQRASHLKPEEEIARAFACCEIACKRLRAQCRLPAPKASGAPCKPGVYRKLVTFLERILDDTVTTPKSTPAGKKRTADGAVKNAAARNKPVMSTKRTGRNEFLGNIKASSRKNADGQDDTEAPSFLMPSVRKLCKTFSTPLLAPHVYTGTSVVLKLIGLWPAGEERSQKDPESLQETVTGLLIALYLMTLTRMKIANMTTSVYKATCGRAVEELAYTPGTKGVEEWIRRINREGYCREQEWWASVPEGVFEFDPDAAEEGVDRGGEDDYQDQEDDEDRIFSRNRPKKAVSAACREMEEEDDPDGVLLPGLATMMQDAVDFLSEERTQEFEVWKKQFLRRLDRPDKSSGVRAGKAVAMK